MMKNRNLFSVLAVMLFSIASFSQTADKMNVAVNEFQAQGISRDEAAIITNRLRSELIKTDKFTVVERGQMETILREQGFQQSGSCASDECIVEVGQMLGVAKMIAGSIGKIGNMFTVNVRVIDVASAMILTTVDADCKCRIEELLTETTKDIAHRLAKNTVITGADKKQEEAAAGEISGMSEIQTGSQEPASAEVTDNKTEADAKQELDIAPYKNGFVFTPKYEFIDQDFYLSLDYIRIFKKHVGMLFGAGWGIIQYEAEFYGGIVFNFRTVLWGINLGGDTFAGLCIRTPLLFKIRRSGILLDITWQPSSGTGGVDGKAGLGGAFFF